MQRVSAIVIGAGQAGLAMSHCLGRSGIDHVVLERGRVAERWRSERWDSLRLLTPNWMSRVPGWSYRGPDPDGFMTMPEVIDYLEGYAHASAAPVQDGTTVNAVRRVGDRFQVETSRGAWRSRIVVVATGHCHMPLVPAVARRLPAFVHQVTPSRYRNPASLLEGGVLVVGASASGLQIADELQRAGREVSLSVGRHVRMPRLYRGRDICWWLDRIGALDRTIGDVPELARARAQPSMQLIGSRDRRGLDLGVLYARGVRILGRGVTADGAVMRFRDDLPETVAAAQRTLKRLLARIDPAADAMGAPPEPEALRPIRLGPSPAGLDLAAERIRTVLWATGYVRDYGWLKLPAALDAAGEIIHDGGITLVPGLYVLGLRFLWRRKSSFLDGVGPDALALSEHILGHLAAPSRAAA
jgi:putative flavoprotein involved in K+ transport